VREATPDVLLPNLGWASEPRSQVRLPPSPTLEPGLPSSLPADRHLSPPERPKTNLTQNLPLCAVRCLLSLRGCVTKESGPSYLPCERYRILRAAYRPELRVALPRRTTFKAGNLRSCCVDHTFPDRARKAGGGFLVGGENWGQGSSREHAAIAPM
jgi:hypothetical protein